MRATIPALTAVLIATVAAGCVPPGAMRTPTDFVILEEAPGSLYEMRATSADGVAVAYRTQANPKKGTLNFWTEAIENHMVKERGYTLEASEKATSRTGRPARLMTYHVTRKGTEFTYMICLYVTDGEVIVAEAGGKSDALAERADAVRESLLSL